MRNLHGYTQYAKVLLTFFQDLSSLVDVKMAEAKFQLPYDIAEKCWSIATGQPTCADVLRGRQPAPVRSDKIQIQQIACYLEAQLR